MVLDVDNHDRKEQTMLAPATQPGNLPVSKPRAQGDGRAKAKEFRSSCIVLTAHPSQMRSDFFHIALALFRVGFGPISEQLLRWDARTNLGEPF